MCSHSYSPGEHSVKDSQPAIVGLESASHFKHDVEPSLVAEPPCAMTSAGSSAEPSSAKPISPSLGKSGSLKAAQVPSRILAGARESRRNLLAGVALRWWMAKSIVFIKIARRYDHPTEGGFVQEINYHNLVPKLLAVKGHRPDNEWSSETRAIIDIPPFERHPVKSGLATDDGSSNGAPW